MRQSFVVLACLTALSCVLAAQDSRPAEPQKAPFVFEAGVISLPDLVDRCAGYLHYNILFDGSELQSANGNGRAQRGGRVGNRAAQGQAAAEPPAEDPGPFVTLALPVVTDRDGCEDLLTGFLWSFGLALVPIDETKHVYEVLSMNGARAREVPMRSSRRTPEQVLARPASKRFVTTVLPLEHTNAQIATNALRPFFASYGGNNLSQLLLGNVGTSRSMVLSGPQDQVANALLVLQQADVEGSEPTPLEQRVEQLANELAKQNAELQRRLAELEQKLAEKK